MNSLSTFNCRNKEIFKSCHNSFNVMIDKYNNVHATCIDCGEMTSMLNPKIIKRKKIKEE